MTYLPIEYIASPHLGGQEGEGGVSIEDGGFTRLGNVGACPPDWQMEEGGELFSGDEDEVPENISQVFFKLGRCHSSEQRKFVFEIMLCFVFNKAKNNHDIYCVVNYFIA